jgi:hypothetical protein
MREGTMPDIGLMIRGVLGVLLIFALLFPFFFMYHFIMEYPYVAFIVVLWLAMVRFVLFHHLRNKNKV